MNVKNTRSIDLGPFSVGGDSGLFLICGPCVIESRDVLMEIAEALKDWSEREGVPMVFKASYDKANRTSLSSFRGPGMQEGLAMLQEVKSQFDFPILTDIHHPSDAAPVSEVADILQIPAFLCRQTDLVAACAASGRTVNIKKGQFLAPWDMEHVLAKARDAGGERVLLTERGTTFGYGNLVNDFRGLNIMRSFGAPVVFDATHSVQMPGGGGSVSSGDRSFIGPLARAAVAVGVDGLFMEVHEDPDSALSDGPNSLPLDQLESLLRTLVTLDEARRSTEAPA
ncbi:MAG: 3-deoxy-8-phosphooctulonate synthase [Kiritimatiellia bacterium]